MAHGFHVNDVRFRRRRSWARRGHACRDGRRNAHIPKDESQSDLVAKRQAQEEGVKQACTRDLFLSQEAAGGVQRQHGRRRGGARQAQCAVPVRRTGSMGPSVGTGDISKPHRRREVFVPRGAPGFSGLSTSPEERSRDGDRGRLRWVPRPQMPADGLTNAELATTNGALEYVIKTGRLTPQQKQAKMKQRSEQPHLKLSLRSAAEQTRNESSGGLSRRDGGSGAVLGQLAP